MMTEKELETAYLMLACNDYRNGTFEGILRGVQLADSELLDLETCLVDDENIDELSGLDIVFDTEDDWFKVTSGEDYIVPILEHKIWVGNWCWDCVLVELPELTKFLNWLMQTNTFWCISGVDTLHDSWNDMKLFTEGLLRKALSESHDILPHKAYYDD